MSLTQYFDAMRSFFASSAEQATLPSLIFNKYGEPIDEKLKLSALILLIEVAKADGKFKSREIDSICASLTNHFAVREDAVPDFVNLALDAWEKPKHLKQYLGRVRREFDVEQKVLLFGLALKVALADFWMQKEERELTDRFQQELGLTKEEAAQAMRFAKTGEV